MSLTYPLDGSGARREGSVAGPVKLTVATLAERKRSGVPITAVTAYDYPTARLADEAGIDLLLVGDSVGMAVLGYADTLSVTMEDMLHHTRAARRGTTNALLVADMPYGSYHVSREETVRNGLRFVQEAGASAVKLEGGSTRVAQVRALTEAEIPVVAHIGLTPQSVNSMGGYKVQGRSAEAIETLFHAALALEDAGAVAVVLEGIPREVAARITASLRIPTIGIGAGPECDGQILVFHDLFHLTWTPKTKFARRFGDAATLFRDGLTEFREAVVAGTFPADSESYHLPAGVDAEPAFRRERVTAGV